MKRHPSCPLCDGEYAPLPRFQRVELARFEVVDTLDETGRGEGGFGSTGR